MPPFNRVFLGLRAAFLTALMITFAAFLLLVFSTPGNNILQLITNRGHFIPDSSSVFTFSVIKMNEGSGEWWLIGEDWSRYYANGLSLEPSYAAISKPDAAACDDFRLTEPDSWSGCNGLMLVGDVGIFTSGN